MQLDSTLQRSPRSLLTWTLQQSLSSRKISLLNITEWWCCFYRLTVSFFHFHPVSSFFWIATISFFLVRFKQLPFSATDEGFVFGVFEAFSKWRAWVAFWDWNPSTEVYILPELSSLFFLSTTFLFIVDIFISTSTVWIQRRRLWGTRLPQIGSCI